MRYLNESPKWEKSHSMGISANKNLKNINMKDTIPHIEPIKLK